MEPTITKQQMKGRNRSFSTIITAHIVLFENQTVELNLRKKSTSHVKLHTVTNLCLHKINYFYIYYHC